MPRHGEHGEATYGVGSYSYTSYTRDWDSRSTHHSEASATGTVSASRGEDRWVSRALHADLGAGLETTTSLSTYVNSLSTSVFTYPSLATAGVGLWSDLGAPLRR